jgi:hypothetical protein
MNTPPPPPVPPYSMPTTFNSTYAQAMQEREELAGLLMELNFDIRGLLRVLKALGHDLSDTHTDLNARTIAAAERLRGGGE